MPVEIYNNTINEYSFSSLTYDTGFYDNNNITFSCDAVVGDVIPAHTSKIYNITFSYASGAILGSASNILNSYLHFNFEIAGSHSVTFYGDESGGHGFATSVAPGGTYVANFGTTNHNVSKVLMGGTELTASQYTFVNNVLTIPNVMGDLVIYAADISTANYVLDPSSPKVEITITNATKLDEFYEQAGFDAVNTSDLVITAINVVIDFTANTNNPQVVDCVLSVNGSTLKTNQISFSGKVSSPLTSSFTGLNIGFEDVLAISFAANNVNNGKVQVTKVTTNMDFGNI